jgi:outer membrane protein
MIKYWLALAAMSAAGLALAQNNDGTTRTIGFSDALRGALLSNPELRREAASKEIAELDVMRARSAFMPRVDLTTTDDKIKLQGGIPGLESLVLAGRTSAYYANGAVRVSLNVFNGGRDNAKVKQASERAYEADLQFRQRRARIAGQALERYHAVLQARIDLKYAQAVVRQAQADLDAVEREAALGRVSTLRRIEAAFDVRAKELECARARSALDAASWELAQAAGLEDTPIAFSEGIADEAQAYRSVLGEFGFQGEQIVTETQLHESRLRQSHGDLPQARSRFMPSLEVHVAESYAGISTNFIGFTLSWNLFEGFDAYADVKQSTLRINAAQANLDAARDEQRRSRRSDERELALASEQLSIERERLDLMDQRLRISRLKTELGHAGMDDTRRSQAEHDLQALEVLRREEMVGFLRAKQLLKGTAS